MFIALIPSLSHLSSSSVRFISFHSIFNFQSIQYTRLPLLPPLTSCRSSLADFEHFDPIHFSENNNNNNTTDELDNRRRLFISTVLPCSSIILIIDVLFDLALSIQYRWNVLLSVFSHIDAVLLNSVAHQLVQMAIKTIAASFPLPIQVIFDVHTMIV